MRSVPPVVVRGGIVRPRSGVHLVTLRRFDDKPARKAKPGPFIPCERRLANVLFLRIQGRDLLASFLNREYARPH